MSHCEQSRDVRCADLARAGVRGGCAFLPCDSPWVLRGAVV